VRDRFAQAGFAGASVPALVGVHVVSALVCAAAARSLFARGVVDVGFALPDRAWVAAGFAVGALIPWLVVSILADRRRRRLAAALPDVLDLLVLSVESGLGLDAALRRVGESVGELSPDFARELAIANAGLQAGQPRADVFRGLEERTGVTDLQPLTDLFLEVDALGTSIVEALRKHVDQMRVLRVQRAKQKAAKLPIKMSVVLPVFFLLPMFIVVVGPIGIRLLDLLDGGSESSEANGAR
jgi:tight adherence protein C